ncbi:MAG: tRNA lysidine(34) synthetase TilS [Acidimicrobiales bacterium]
MTTELFTTEQLAAATAGLLGRCRFPAPGTAVTCAVSGGPDSLGLLALAAAARCRVTAVHVDHGLRPGGSGEAGLVAAAAASVGAEFRSERVALDAGPNLQERARRARWSVLGPGTLTGHTADDLAETVLINLMRGAGAGGLAAGGGPRHPLVALRRHEMEQLCDRLGWTPVRDPSNTNPAYLRNRVRHELIPLMNQLAGRDVVPVICRQGDLLSSEDAFLDLLAGDLDPTDSSALRAAPVVLARRAVRGWLRAGQDHPPDLATVDRVLEVAGGRVGGTDVGRGRRVRRSSGRLRLESPVPSAGDGSGSTP